MNKNSLTKGMCEPLPERDYIQSLLSPINNKGRHSEERSIAFVAKHFGEDTVRKYGSEHQNALLSEMIH